MLTCFYLSVLQDPMDAFVLIRDQRRAGWKGQGSYSSPEGPWVSYPTDKTFRVPQGVQGRNVVFQDGPGTASTLGSKHVEVVLAAVGFAVLLMKSCQRRTKSISS